MTKDARDIQKLVAKAKDDIIKEVNDRLPRKVGVVAVNHFKQNFRDYALAPLRPTLHPSGVFPNKNPDYYIGGMLFDGKSMMGVQRSGDKKNTTMQYSTT